MNAPLLQLTQAAIAHIKARLAQNVPPQVFRLSIEQAGCTGWMYQPVLAEKPKASDFAIPLCDDLTIYLDEHALDKVKGTTIDYVQVSLGQWQLAYHNPNVDSSCGCGESFHLKTELRRETNE